MTPEQLKEYREGLGLSQLDFGQWLGKRFANDWFKRTNTTVSQWERGEQKIPSWMDALTQEEVES